MYIHTSSTCAKFTLMRDISESASFDLNTYMTIGKTVTSPIHLDTRGSLWSELFQRRASVFPRGETLPPWTTNRLSLDASRLDSVMMNRSLCDVLRRGALGTRVTCGHILNQSRYNFNSINSKQRCCDSNGGSEVPYKRDRSR